uniref:Predicted protein n=1 Tax=Hordeum vulgare subsp. vulgare TaxID=112509 RepID=F2D394_HORVV|nr:predicted protein [Hordeum vulgare subsp. vulgare]
MAGLKFSKHNNHLFLQLVAYIGGGVGFVSSIGAGVGFVSSIGAGVGFVFSIGAGVASDVLYAAHRVLSATSIEAERLRAPIWKAASVYSGFLGTSANLRYQVIAGLVEHRLGEYLVSYYNQPFLSNVLSFVARIINSYFGTQLFQRSLELHNLSRDETINQLRCTT